MASLKIHRGPINSDPAAEVPRAHWGELLDERRKFCQQIVPQDCRNLLFFIQDGAANDWLGFEDRERYIREGLKLDPKMVGWALKGLKATRPDVAVKFADAVKIGKKGGQPGNRNAAKDRNESSATRFVSLGKLADVAYFRERLKNDGRTDLLSRIDRGEISVNAAAMEAKYIKRRVRVCPTLAGIRELIDQWFTPEEREQLKQSL